jgi:hypothetical protein
MVVLGRGKHTSRGRVHGFGVRTAQYHGRHCRAKEPEDSSQHARPARSPNTLARVKLGFKATVDMSAGLFSVQAQWFPNSYTLNGTCYLGGGFTLCYWFKTTESGREDDWVFTIGGYHAACRFLQIEFVLLDSQLVSFEPLF